MNFNQVPTILFFWLCIGFIDKMELSAIQKRATGTVCGTAECNEGAQYIVNNMDLKEDPCMDFYQYSCGHFISKTKLPADRIQYGVPEILAQNALEQIQQILTSPGFSFTPEVRKAQQMYSACLIQANDIFTLQNEVLQLGGWPIAEFLNFDFGSISFEELLAKLVLKGTSAILSAKVTIDLTNSNLYILGVNNGELPVDPTLLRSQASQNSYSNFIQTSALALGATNILNIRPQINDIITFTNQLAAITPPNVEAINFTTLYHKMSIKQLQQKTDPDTKTFNWLTFFNELTNLKLTSNEEIGVFNEEFLIKAINLIKSTNRNTVLNYAIWCFVVDYAWTVGGEVEQAYLAVQRTLTGVSQNPPRNTTCAEFVNSLWGFALAKPYVAKVFPSSDIQQVKQVAQSLLNTYDGLLSSNVSYLHGTAQEVAVQKVAQMKLLIGYPQWINSDSAVQEYFKNYPASTLSSLTNSLNAIESQVKQNLQLLGTTVDRNRFDSLPADITAEYDLSLNSISFPAALLQQPIFTAGKQIQSLNYGLLGAISGVEINNAIDYIGSQFDANGNLNDWWSPDVAVNVGKDVTCVTNQYDKYCSKINPNICIDGAATALEHIADYDGALITFYAYEQWVAKNGQEKQLPGLTQFTSEQLLFISWAQQFCTATVPKNIVNTLQRDPQLENRYRVIGALSDISAFAKVFSCNVGPMNRGNASCIPF